jgi:type IV secretory pathway VirB3-like protein
MESFPATVKISKGSWKVRTLARLPLEASLVLGGATLLFCLAFHTLWALLVVVPLWGFFKWHTRKDPRFLQTWSGQISYKRYYSA